MQQDSEIRQWLFITCCYRCVLEHPSPYPRGPEDVGGFMKIRARLWRLAAYRLVEGSWNAMEDDAVYFSYDFGLFVNISLFWLVESWLYYYMSRTKETIYQGHFWSDHFMILKSIFRIFFMFTLYFKSLLKDTKSISMRKKIGIW